MSDDKKISNNGYIPLGKGYQPTQSTLQPRAGAYFVRFLTKE
jgi:hypothetical protein